MAWTTPDEIVRQLQRRWDDGSILRSSLTGAALFPLKVRFSDPSPRDLRDRFGEVRGWIELLRNTSRENRGFGYDLQWTEQKNQQIGRQRIPSGAVVPTEEDALRLLSRGNATRSFRELAQATLAEFPELRDWLVRAPLKVLDHAEHWLGVLAVLRWFRAHPRPGLYLRQLDIPGIDTKFIETHARLVLELIEVVMSGTAGTAGQTLEQRLGLQSKPVLVRMRLLDEDLFLHGISDISLPVQQAARLTLPVARVFITENEINGLAFPALQRSVVLFGFGYGVDRLGEIPWLHDRPVHYWGDIDTHGFAMLDRVRSLLPQVSSLLMGRDTLLAHRELWVREAAQWQAPLLHLKPEESRLYEDLRLDRLGQQIRLEQERISFTLVHRVLERCLQESDVPS